ncbi:hypothetical protein C0J52_15203 [Blattella germanica]|nr:hypothetical protein C0J52_15203 [Blattella germanica]
MRVVLCVTLLLAGAVNCGLVAGPVATLVRAPKYDSAIIQSDRLGGNFAYSTAEAHAYAVVSPIVQNVVKPVAVSYTAEQVLAPVAVVPSSHQVVAVDHPVENVGKPVAVSYSAPQVAPRAFVPPSTLLSTAVIDVPVPVHDAVASPSYSHM